MSPTISDASTALYIKALMGKDTPEFFKLEKNACAKDHAKTPEDAYIAACKALIDNDKDALDTHIKFASHFGVAKDVQTFGQKLLAEQKNSFMEKYAYVHKNTYAFPVDTPSNISKSDRQFSKGYMKIRIEDRAKIASIIVDKALSGGIYKIAHQTLAYAAPYSNLPIINWLDAAHNIGIRATLVSDPLVKKSYVAIAKVLAIGELDHAGIIKIAHTVEKLDRHSNLYPYFKTRSQLGEDIVLCDPLTEIFSCTKEAAVYDVPVGNLTMSAEEIKNLPIKILTNSLGGEMAQKIKTSQPKLVAETMLAADPMAKVILGKYIKEHRAQAEQQDNVTQPVTSETI